MLKIWLFLWFCNSMAYPSTIPGAPSGQDFGFAAYPSAYTGGFEYNGNLYVFASDDGQNSGTLFLHAFQSTDAGQAWAELDAAHSPGGPTRPGFSNGAPGGPQYTVARDGSIALVFSVQFVNVPNTHFSQVQLIRFDLSTGLWSTITSFAVPGTLDIQSEYTGQVAPDATVIVATSINLIVLGPNNYILYYSGPGDVVGGLLYGRLWYVTFTGTSFGTPAKLPNQTGAFTYVSLGVGVLTSVNVLQFFYANNDTSGSVSMYSVGLDLGSFAFGTTTPIPFSLQYWANSNLGSQACTASNPIVYTPSGGSETIAIASEVQSPPPLDDNNHLILAFYNAAAALNLTWQKSIVTGPSVDDASGNGGTTDQTIFPMPEGVGFLGHTLTMAQNNQKIAIALGLADLAFGGHVYYATSPTNALSWTATTKLLDTGPIPTSSGDTSAVQLLALPMTGGIGVLSVANDFNNFTGKEIMQFDFIASPGPTCTLSANPTTIVSGNSSLLTWTTANNPTTAFIDNNVGYVNPAGGTFVVSPTVTTTYHLTVSNINGSSNCQVTITVTPAPPTCTLLATPSTVAQGGSVILSWNTQNTPTSASIDNGIGSVNPAGGSVIVNPTTTTTYHLTVTNAAGSSNCQATVIVVAGPGIPPNTPCARKIDCEIQFYKHPLDAMDFTIDWSGWLEPGDQILTSTWNSDVGITLGATTINGAVMGIRVSGGTDTFAYLLRNMITTAYGITSLRTAAVNVAMCHIDPPDPPMLGEIEDLFKLVKNPLANMDIAIDWSSWLGSDRIANFSFVPDVGITATTLQFSPTATSARIGGGLANNDYLVEHKILTQLGRTGIRHIVVQVRSCN